MKHELIIVGAGASGIIAAINAKNSGIDVAILESNNRIAKKLLTTGNGRCNITNENITLDRYHSNNPRFFEHTLKSFNLTNTLEFFSTLGLHLTTLENGKMYPLSLQSSSVVDILKASLEEKEIPVYLDTKVKDIHNSKKGFKIYASTPEDDSLEYNCKKLILCCGGKSAPKTGSDGSGFSLARKIGHSIIEPLPALVQLKLNYKKLKALSGVKFDGSAKLFLDEKLIQEDFGEILFTDYGISGPPILQLSRNASRGIYNRKKVTLKVDMMSTISKENLIEFLENHWGVFGYRSIHDLFIGIINKKVIPILLKESGIDNMHKPCWNLTWQEKNSIFNILKAWEFEVIGTNGFNNAQVTSGGINTEEIDSTTLESKLIPNLYFCGEILDVDGDCGGFNLQWAWSSGIIASNNASNH
ncbi:NAD(P)/FAD-dependent oxidoreductase [Clostridium botulinum]|uniref:NAD(P)/FAD-dependent oxidoreductase n=1 Tax=Clostridium botulinum TaxID=1491 RepID=UPI001E604CDB|nr:NAD(P)/FAD-dependent oxidoreductase [Clostridium botulinum]MCD3233977.1 NAD(P)/FAD-dependent oxidoreductase [Clostridium botulinum D/C]MCD3314508.1 NAD(P)/FAD-dependent oxidoreductase [Clostridium botulinum D/C]